jgi:hypothetical protein
MAAPTNAAYVKKALANSEPSTHGTFKAELLRACDGRADNSRCARPLASLSHVRLRASDSASCRSQLGIGKASPVASERRTYGPHRRNGAAPAIASGGPRNLFPENRPRRLADTASEATRKKSVVG